MSNRKRRKKNKKPSWIFVRLFFPFFSPMVQEILLGDGRPAIAKKKQDVPLFPCLKASPGTNNTPYFAAKKIGTKKKTSDQRSISSMSSLSPHYQRKNPKLDNLFNSCVRRPHHSR